MQNISIRDELNTTLEEFENESKNYEDLEFQHLEEEAEWSAYHEELQHELHALTKKATEKAQHVAKLQSQGAENQRTAGVDSSVLESEVCKLQSDLMEKHTHLRQIDQHIFDITGQSDLNSESEDDDDCDLQTIDGNHIEHMSQSLFGSHENLKTKAKTFDVMSRSVNENMFYDNNIESRMPFYSTPKRGVSKLVFNNDTEQVNDYSDETPHHSLDEAYSITMLKYNLSPPFQHKVPLSSDSSDEAHCRAQLNLSIESDDFEVNPLEKRVPSQDDIDRICKVTLDAPISMQGASYKVIESIKEIERNRQLLLAQQGWFLSN